MGLVVEIETTPNKESIFEEMKLLILSLRICLVRKGKQMTNSTKLRATLANAKVRDDYEATCLAVRLLLSYCYVIKMGIWPSGCHTLPPKSKFNN